MGLDDVVKSIVELPKDVYPKEVPKILDYIAKNCRLDIEYQEVRTGHYSIKPKERPRNFFYQNVFEFNGRMPNLEISFTCAAKMPDIEGIFRDMSSEKAFSGKISSIEFSTSKDEAYKTLPVLTDIKNKIADYFAKKAKKKHS